MGLPPMRIVDLPATDLTYAIGDIHGRLDLLERAFDLIDAHAGMRRFQVVCLGDYVDRGPDSRGVIDVLRRKAAGPRLTCLKGNHETMMLEALEEGEWSVWLDNGGDETLASYPDGVPAEHLDWLRDLPICARDADRLYVHAGFMPGASLADQGEEACLWIRGRFLNAEADDLPGHVVHGHTPKHPGKLDMAQPERLPHRTNLDTGACWTGVLSIGVFEPGQAEPVEVFAVRSGSLD
jgi:serine/threonine protein phosphatase 1